MNVFIKKVGRGINRHRMIEAGEEILISVSGGKDSLALCLALAQRKAWIPMDYRLRGLFIDWREYPAGAENRKRLAAFMERLNIPFRIVEASIYPRSYDKPFNCYICSRNRKRILFQEAQAFGITKIAVGHHLDDIIETTLMNLFYKGEIATMLPIQNFFDGKIKIIRPMCEVEEREVLRLLNVYPLPVFDIHCPRKTNHQRLFFKELIKQVKRVNKHVKDNLYNAPGRINRDYLP
ncbi:MAG: tRNA 2-thiocytidine biosynthesis protein TtcA [Spirochaetaceae bacterium]|nr:MAG: tRNA 2-thiocytidine biosynthesis protein TtcA [Spirochaetaceae bacterium]